MNRLPVLYGKDLKGNIKEWRVVVDGKRITVMTGRKGGTLTPSVSSGSVKNEGRSNEICAEQDAINQAKSRWEKQKKKLYRETVEELENLPVLPQLALDYLKRGKSAKYPALVQPKLNGMRGLRKPSLSAFVSREHNTIRRMEHIEEQLRWMRSNCPHWVDTIDGEFYIHGFYLSDIISLIKRSQRDSILLEFHIFDFEDKHLVQSARMAHLNKIYRWMKDNQKACGLYARNIKVVFTESVASEEEFIRYQHKCEEKGFEGAMLRSPASLYTSGPTKTTAIFKRKSFQDAEFKTLDITEGEEGRAILHFKTKEGRSFKAELIGSDEVTQEVVHNRANYIGQPATVKFQELSKYGVPTIGVKAMAFRNYE